MAGAEHRTPRSCVNKKSWRRSPPLGLKFVEGRGGQGNFLKLIWTRKATVQKLEVDLKITGVVSFCINPRVFTVVGLRGCPHLRRKDLFCRLMDERACKTRTCEKEKPKNSDRAR